MPKFKQLTATTIKAKRSSTIGECEINEGGYANCSNHQYQNETDCVNASETWTASFTKATCNALTPYDDVFYSWNGTKELDTSDDFVVNVDLEEIKSFSQPVSPIDKTVLLTTHTLVIFKEYKYNIKKTLAEWMEIMAIEVK